MELRLFGEIQLRCGDRLLDVGIPRQQAVLAVLAVDAGRLVTVETLIDRVWNDTPPSGARNALYSYLSRIRQLFRHASSLTGVVTRIDRRNAGYVLELDPDVVDLHRFARLIDESRNSPGGDEDRAAALTTALGLWRGTPLAGLQGDWVDQVRSNWHRRRLDAVVRWGSVALRLGRADEVISTVGELVVEYPLAESLEGLFMRALHAAGRDAEAVERYAVVRRRLADELGIDPGNELRSLHGAILRGELPDVDGGTGDPACAPPVPRQLPAYASRFIGRAEELGQLTKLLDESTPHTGETVVITAIDGTAGVGKTALALHWAHHIAERFPDGQLYANLRGFDPTNTPVRPGEVLRDFLQALGVRPQSIPATMDAQAALFRSVVIDRRLLVVLDNAYDADHVRSLLPASPTCLVVITSRNRLADLVAREGAYPITLDVLTPEESHALLSQRIGHERINADPHAVAELIEQCARLPLALAIVAARADTDPGVTTRELADELADIRTRLEGLDTGEDTTSVRAVLSWSYHHLSAPTARMFRLLGLHPGPDIDLLATARLAGLKPNQARRTLAELVRAHLLTQPTPGRYTCHDLLRAYAVELAATHDSQGDQTNALVRLFDHYLHTSAAAARLLHPHDQLWQGIPHSTTSPSPITDPAVAEAWFDTERPNLTAAVIHSAARGWHVHADRLANLLIMHGVVHSDERPGSPTIYGQALRSAQMSGDRTTEAYALTFLGIAYWQHGRYQQAADCHHRAIVISRDIGNPVGEVLALNYLGLVHWRQGHFSSAAEHHQRALTISRDNNIRVVEAMALNYLGFVHLHKGEDHLVTDRCHEALEICRDIGYQPGETMAMNVLGLIHIRQDRWREAGEHLQQALTISRNIGDRVSEGLALNNLGRVYCQQGDHAQAIDYHNQALTIFSEIRYLVGQAHTLSNLGIVHRRQARYREAIDYHHQALNILHEIEDRVSEPNILNDLGDTCHAAGDREQARTHHTAALALATELGDSYERAHAEQGLTRDDSRRVSSARGGTVERARFTDPRRRLV